MGNVIDLNKNFAQYKYWSNGCGDLHHHGEYDISLEELPTPLQRVYNDLFSEGQFCMNCYLTEYKGEYGISLEAEYDLEYAKDLGITYEELIAAAREKAAALAEAFPQYTVMFGLDTEVWNNGDRSSQMVLFLPADITAEEYNKAGTLADKIVWPNSAASD